MPKTLLHLSFKEKIRLFVDFEFLSEISSWQTTNRFPLVGEKSSNGKWLRIVFRKNRPRTGISPGNARERNMCFQVHAISSRHLMYTKDGFDLSRKLLNTTERVTHRTLRNYYCYGSISGFVKALQRQILLLGLLVIPGSSSKGHAEYYSLTKNQEHTTLPSIATTSDRQRARVKEKMFWNQLTRWRELESTYYVTSMSAQIPVPGRFFFFSPRRFQRLTTFQWRIFLKLTGID